MERKVGLSTSDHTLSHSLRVEVWPSITPENDHDEILTDVLIFAVTGGRTNRLSPVGSNHSDPLKGGGRKNGSEQPCSHIPMAKNLS